MKGNKKKKHQDSDDDSNDESIDAMDDEDGGMFDMLEKDKITKSFIDGLKNL